MFGLFHKKEEFDSWYTFIVDFQTSTSDFYTEIEKELENAKVPGLEIKREVLSEGGMLSAKREYLRLRREALFFDICAAPFGTAWFFSCRKVFIPFSLRVWEIVAMGVLLMGIVQMYTSIFGVVVGSITFGLSIVSLVILLSNTLALGLLDLDAVILRLPVVGAFYQALFRKESYYRKDTRLMYLEMIDYIVKKKIEETTSAKGVKFVEYKEDSNEAENKFTSFIKQVRKK
jgi:hypothetical protein